VIRRQSPTGFVDEIGSDRLRIRDQPRSQVARAAELLSDQRAGLEAGDVPVNADEAPVDERFLAEAMINARHQLRLMREDGVLPVLSIIQVGAHAVTTIRDVGVVGGRDVHAKRRAAHERPNPPGLRQIPGIVEDEHRRLVERCLAIRPHSVGPVPWQSGTIRVAVIHRLRPSVDHTELEAAREAAVHRRL